MVQLDPDRSAGITYGKWFVESAVADPKVIEQSQGLAREIAELRVGAFGLELGDNDDGEDDIVLVESGDGPRIGEQDTRVEDVGPAVTCRPLAGRRRWSHSTAFPTIARPRARPLGTNVRRLPCEPVTTRPTPWGWAP
jgi:hypothetical protein